jgi:hypothetical protein
MKNEDFQLSANSQNKIQNKITPFAESGKILTGRGRVWSVSCWAGSGGNWGVGARASSRRCVLSTSRRAWLKYAATAFFATRERNAPRRFQRIYNARGGENSVSGSGGFLQWDE